MQKPSSNAIKNGAAFIAFVAIGAVMLSSSYDTWLQQEMWIKSRGIPQRLITYAANPTEFLQRLTFGASMGGFLFSMGVAALALLVRQTILQRTGPLTSMVAKVLILVPAVCGVVCLALFAYLPLHYK